MKELGYKPVKAQKNVAADIDVKSSKFPSYFRALRTSLRARVALGVALPILLLLISLSLMRYRYERQLLADQVQLTAMQLGKVMMGSLRHTLLSNDRKMLNQILQDMGEIEAVQQAQIIDLNGRVKVDSRKREVGLVRSHNRLGCWECHQFPVGSRPPVTKLFASAGLLRIAMPFNNDSDCVGCHKEVDTHLGMLLIDIPAINIEERLRHNLQLDLAVSVGSTVLVTLGLYLLIHWLVVRRVETFHHPLAEFAAGDLTARLPSPPALTDELGELANIFNHMAAELERRAHEQEEHSKLRQRAIVEERGRIARELHDGLAQLLGYVNTKIMAARLMLKNQQTAAADQNLRQLEEAARELFVDVRGAILDLKMTGERKTGLAATLKEFTAQFSQFSDLPVELTLASAVESLALSGETELQLLRIVQEALANARKHASATQAWITLRVVGTIGTTNDQTLELTVSDNGQGFDPNHIPINYRPHFGLSTMRERAEAIKAHISLDSKPGAGTRVIVRLPLEEK